MWLERRQKKIAKLEMSKTIKIKYYLKSESKTKCWESNKAWKLIITISQKCHTVRQVALSWCLVSSICQFGNGIPKSGHLRSISEACTEATEFCI